MEVEIKTRNTNPDTAHHHLTSMKIGEQKFPISTKDFVLPATFDYRHKLWWRICGSVSGTECILNKITILTEMYFNLTQFNTCVVKIKRNVNVLRLNYGPQISILIQTTSLCRNLIHKLKDRPASLRITVPTPFISKVQLLTCTWQY
jgi:hypothetical protein